MYVDGEIHQFTEWADDEASNLIKAERVFFSRASRGMPTANAEDRLPIRRYLETRLAETFPTPPSDSIYPSAFAVGMRRKVAENRSAPKSRRK